MNELLIVLAVVFALGYAVVAVFWFVIFMAVAISARYGGVGGREEREYAAKYAKLAVLGLVWPVALVVVVVRLVLKK